MNNTNSTYYPEVDGLRAFAVVAVLLFHFDFGLPGGFVGVDIFFVISGYLITSILKRELERGEFSFVKFWERRIRRLAPALIAVLVATFIGCYFLYLPRDLVGLAYAMLSQVCVGSNYYHLFQSGYFAPESEALPLLHTWSLAVEEQFYLIFPFLIWGINRFFKQRFRLVLVTLLLISLTYSLWSTFNSPNWAFFSLPSRAWELLAGCCLATFPKPQIRNRFFCESVAVLMVAVLIGSVLFLKKEMPFPGYVAMVPVIATVGFLLASSAMSLTSLAAFRWSPVVFIGRISYSLYLIHWPIWAAYRYWFWDVYSPRNNAILLGISIVGAILSYFFIEQPFRNRTVLKNRAHLFGAFGFAAALILSMNVVILQNEGLPDRFRLKEHKALISQRSGYDQFPSTTADNMRKNRLHYVGTKSTESDILIWGDSHAKSLLPAFETILKERGKSGIQITNPGTPPLILFDVKENPPDMRRNGIEVAEAMPELVNNRKFSTVILAGRWSLYGSDPKFAESLNATVNLFQNAGARVVLIKEVGCHKVRVHKYLARRELLGIDLSYDGISKSEYEKQTRISEQAIAIINTNGFELVDLSPFLTDAEGNWQFEANELSYYIDSNHLTEFGAQQVAPALRKAVR